MLVMFVTAAFLVSIYGYGQKYLSWPVYSTMNREFAKGWRLVLTEFARVNSTFAGHYDLAAFTVIALPLMVVLFILSRRRLYRLLTAVTFILLLGILLLTASRTSFIAYLVALNVVFVLLYPQLKLKRTLINWAIFFGISIMGLLTFGPLYSRYAHLLKPERFQAIIENSFLGKIIPTKQLAQITSGDLNLVYTESDTPPSIANPTPNPNTNTALPPDVFVDIPENAPEASLSAIPTTSGTGLEGKKRNYSSTAYDVGLSSAIRLDALWPRALAGFKKNPLLGTGYSTLTKTQQTEFTEAESTDNDFLRTLGETGLLGVISFFGIFAYAVWILFKALRNHPSRLETIINITLISAIIGLCVNALYIDIFESSKVAYVIWSLLGIAFGLFHLNNKTHAQN
jgi:hypothetical protein